MCYCCFILEIKITENYKNYKYSNHYYHIQDIKDVQHKNINVTWDNRNFPRHPVDAESSKWEEEILFFCIIIIGLIHNLIKVFLRINGLNMYVQPVLINLINIGYQLYLHHPNQGMPTLKVFTIKKLLNFTMIWPSCNY